MTNTQDKLNFVIGTKRTDADGKSVFFADAITNDLASAGALMTFSVSAREITNVMKFDELKESFEARGDTAMFILANGLDFNQILKIVDGKVVVDAIAPEHSIAILARIADGGTNEDGDTEQSVSFEAHAAPEADPALVSFAQQLIDGMSNHLNLEVETANSMPSELYLLRTGIMTSDLLERDTVLGQNFEDRSVIKNLDESFVDAMRTAAKKRADDHREILMANPRVSSIWEKIGAQVPEDIN